MKNLLVAITIILSLTSSAQTATEIEMVTLVNQVRTNPKSFIPVVEAYMTEMSTATKTLSGGVKMTRKVNPALITELKFLISFLKTVKPVGELTTSTVLYPITKKFVNYLDSVKQITHIGPNGQTLADRTKSTGLLCGENCTTGGDINHAMILLLLDFKAEVKGHRNNIFNPKFTKIAVANSNGYWVQDFAY